MRFLSVLGLGWVGVVLLHCDGGFVVAAFEHEHWDRNTEQDQDADQGDGWGRPEVLWAHQGDEDSDARQDGEGGDGHEHGPMQASTVWRMIRGGGLGGGLGGTLGGGGMRNKFTHHLGWLHRVVPARVCPVWESGLGTYVGASVRRGEDM